MTLCVNRLRVRAKRREIRQGNVIVLAAIMMVTMMGMLAFACDLGYLLVGRTELQRAADSAALASTSALLDERRLLGGAYMDDVQSSARDAAAQFASLNWVLGDGLAVELNSGNEPEGDVVVGRFDGGAGVSTAGDADRYNAVQVRVQRSVERNGEISLFFSRIFGQNSYGMTANAIASYEDRISGFRVTEKTGNAKLLPFGLDIKDWNNVLNGQGFDDWSYDAQTDSVFHASDGLREVKLFPSKPHGNSGITPGNFGTLDIGSQNNSSATLMRQIREGVSKDDLAYHGGELKLNPSTGELPLDGDTGIDSNLALALDDIIGQARAIPLYSKISGNGDTATYTIVGFAGIRILDFDLHTNNKYIMIQPALVVDDSAIGDGEHKSYAVVQPVILRR